MELNLSETSEGLAETEVKDCEFFDESDTNIDCCCSITNCFAISQTWSISKSGN